MSNVIRRHHARSAYDSNLIAARGGRDDRDETTLKCTFDA